MVPSLAHSPPKANHPNRKSSILFWTAPDLRKCRKLSRNGLKSPPEKARKHTLTSNNAKLDTLDTSVCESYVREVTTTRNTPMFLFFLVFLKSLKSNPFLFFNSSLSLLLYFKLPCPECPYSSSSSKTPGRKRLMRFTTWTPQGHLRPQSAVLDESAKIIIRFLSGFSGSSQVAKPQVRTGALPPLARAHAHGRV